MAYSALQSLVEASSRFSPRISGNILSTLTQCQDAEALRPSKWATLQPHQSEPFLHSPHFFPTGPKCESHIDKIDYRHSLSFLHKAINNTYLTYRFRQSMLRCSISLEESISQRLIVPENPDMVDALGAALYGLNYQKK